MELTLHKDVEGTVSVWIDTNPRVIGFKEYQKFKMRLVRILKRNGFNSNMNNGTVRVFDNANTDKIARVLQSYKFYVRMYSMRCSWCNIVSVTTKNGVTVLKSLNVSSPKWLDNGIMKLAIGHESAITMVEKELELD